MPPKRRPQRTVNHPRFTSVNHKPRLRREDVFVRRAVPHCLALMGAGAAVLAAAFAHAQPAATRQGLRPSFEETDQYPRLEAPRRPARRDTRPVGAAPNASSSDTQSQTLRGAGFGRGHDRISLDQCEAPPVCAPQRAPVIAGTGRSLARANRHALAASAHAARHQPNDRFAGDAGRAFRVGVPNHVIDRFLDGVLDRIENCATIGCRETSHHRRGTAAFAAAQSAAARPGWPGDR